MRTLCLLFLASLLTGCGLSAYNPHFIVSDGPQVTVEQESSQGEGSTEEPAP